MNSEVLIIHPHELQFAFEVNKHISCTMQVTNNTDNHVAFKVKTTNPKKYCVRPNTGIVLPHSTYDLLVTMQAQKEAPADMQCKDRFLLQSVIISPEFTIKDITSDTFNKESGNHIDEYKLKVVYISPPQPLSSVREGFKDEGSPKVSVSDHGSLDAAIVDSISHGDYEDDLIQAKDLISRLTEEKYSTIQSNKKLHQELDILRLEISRKRSAIPYMYLIVVGLIGILVGYIVNRT